MSEETEKGWQCPKCQAVLSPTQMSCYLCKGNGWGANPHFYPRDED